MLVLLRESPDPEWELKEMSRLTYEDFPAVIADPFRPVAFVNDVFGVGGAADGEYALKKKEEGFDPLEAADSAIDLLHRILPPSLLNHLD
jgi:hypothetical protein